MNKLIADFVGKRTWAIVGATSDSTKFGYKIFYNLKNAGYDGKNQRNFPVIRNLVYGVNPKGGNLDSNKLYQNLSELMSVVKVRKVQVNIKISPSKPGDLVVDIVVPPTVTEKVVVECKSLGIRRIWMQPGAESQKAIQYCNENGIGPQKPF